LPWCISLFLIKVSISTIRRSLNPRFFWEEIALTCAFAHLMLRSLFF